MEWSNIVRYTDVPTPSKSNVRVQSVPYKYCRKQNSLHTGYQ